MTWTRGTLLAMAVLLLLSGGCRSTYYSAWEKLGWAKRDILVDRVEDARNAQEAAKEQFKTTLERLQELTGFQGGNLEGKYKQLNTEYEDSEKRAGAVTKRVNDIETVANDLFKEWQKELEQYHNAELRRSSEQQLRQTRERYQQLIAAMRRSEQTMQPVLDAFHDQVLFLKHNLNAQAIASLQATTAQIQDDVQRLIREMEASIAEANTFIAQMKTSEQQ